MDLTIFTPIKPHKNVLAVEKAGLLYNLLTTLLLLVLYPKMANPNTMLLERAGIVVGVFLLISLHRKFPSQTTLFLRYLFQFALLGYWYADTFEFNRHFPNLDHLFASWEQQLFQCQPAVEFSKVLDSRWISEAMHMGYFSYYPMILVVALYFLFVRNNEFDRFSFVIMGSFFCYYLIYIALPVTGPQFYFGAIGWESVSHGTFPPVGDYFNYHQEILPSPGDASGFFYRCVEGSQAAGERPTAAFPSSHTGIATILLFFMYNRSKILFYFLLPFYFFLVCATVYIQAHYLIDVFAGWVSCVCIYSLCCAWYDKSFALQPHRLKKRVGADPCVRPRM